MSSAPSTFALPESPTVSEAVVSAVSDAEGVSPLDLQPLATVVDPDALERLVESMESQPGAPSGGVEFTYCGYRVTVTGGRKVDVLDLDR